MAHKSGNTSEVSKSSSDLLNYTGFPGDVFVTFFNVLPGNKDAVMLNPLTFTFTFTFMHLAEAFIQSDLQYIQDIHFLSRKKPLCLQL